MRALQAIPQWENVFGGSPVTCLDASESKSTLVAASEAGGVAWLKLDHAMSVSKIGASSVSTPVSRESRTLTGVLLMPVVL